MHIFHFFLTFILNIDKSLSLIIDSFGFWTYFILFSIIFAETGLIIVPFLPGDSLLFAIGIVSVQSELNIHIIVPILILASLIGDNCNYWIGRLIGNKLFSNQAKFFKKQHLIGTRMLFKKYGAKAIILSRFIAIFRTLIPFSAGMSYMPYKKFILLSLIASVIWVSLLSYLGYFFGNFYFIREYYGVFILVIILISCLSALSKIIKYYINYFFKK